MENSQTFRSDCFSKENYSLGDLDEDVAQKKKEEKKRLKLEQRQLIEENEFQLRKDKALKSVQYLLKTSLQFAHFMKPKIQSELAKSKTGVTKNRLNPKVEDLMDEDIFVEKGNNDLQNNNKIVTSQSLKYFEGGTLRPYQEEGLNWLMKLYANGINGILADEMGLGKTIQVIALICHLLQENVDGPFLIVAPLSTVLNWVAEFKRFAPKVPVVLFYGDQDTRHMLQKKIQKSVFELDGRTVRPVVITTFQYPYMMSYFFARFTWHTLVVDEGHRIKNHESRLSRELRNLQSLNRLILTGTPLQNNLTELWSLLNFLLPHIFTDVESFSSLLLAQDLEDENKFVEHEKSTKIVLTIHKVLEPFMLRRLKKDVLHDIVPKKEVMVYCPLTKLQRDLYTYIINKNITKLQGQIEEDKDEIIDVDATDSIAERRLKRKCSYNKKYTELTEDDVENLFYEDFAKHEEKIMGKKIDTDTVRFVYRLTMQNSMMMFKKVVDHPFLVHFPLKPNSEVKELLVDEQIVQQSGKMLVLDAILPILKRRGHKVLLFSTLVMMLEIIEDYLLLRNYNYRKLHGGMNLEDRQENIDEFNNDPDVLIFLVSTRAGGLGLNLTGADTVIFYDRDWNPQVDIQAQDRCHRIGQTKPVVVYSLVTKNTIDDEVVHCGNLKRKLEKLIITKGSFQPTVKADVNKVENDLRYLKKLLNCNDAFQQYTTGGGVYSNQELYRILDRSDLYEEMKKSKVLKL